MRRAYKAHASASAPTADQATSAGYPTEGDPAADVPATVPGPYWFHMVTEAVATVIELAGQTLSDVPTQFRDALKAYFAPIASPVFTGDPQAPTPDAADDDTSLATTEWVRRHVGNIDLPDLTTLQTALASVWRPGDLKTQARAAVPDGWLLCDGSAVSRDTYADLYAAIGDTWGEGDGSTTFNLPNFKGRFPLGANDARPVGTTGGAETHTLTTDEMPSHSHGKGTLATSLGGRHSHSSGTLEASSAGSHSHGDGTLSASSTGSHKHGDGTLSASSAGSHTHNYNIYSTAGATTYKGAHHAGNNDVGDGTTKSRG